MDNFHSIIAVLHVLGIPINNFDSQFGVHLTFGNAVLYSYLTEKRRYEDAAAAAVATIER